MNKEPEDIDQILPYGELLRGFMEQSFVGKADLKKLLRNRGIFVCNDDKHDTIPIISSTILSPAEFDYLRECQNAKEDNPKIITQVIKWESPETLLESIPEKFDIDSFVNLDFSNYKVLGSPQFIPIDRNPDEVKMEFSIEREDMSKNWSTNKSIFPGSLEIKKIREGQDIKLVVTHTASETKKVANQISSNLVKSFKEQGHIDPSARIEKILFSEFSNPKRIVYLLSLTKECSSTMLEFIDIVDVEFSPDKDNPLPEGIDWMERRIEDLRLNGNSLHQTFFFSDNRYHDFLHLYKVDAKFKFLAQGASGECVMSVGFPDYGKDKNINAEMEVNITRMAFDLPPRGLNRASVKRSLLREVEIQKIENFQKYSKANDGESIEV